MAIAVYFINLFLQARHCYADLDQTKQRSENTIQLHNIKNREGRQKIQVIYRSQTQTFIYPATFTGIKYTITHKGSRL